MLAAEERIETRGGAEMNPIPACYERIEPPEEDGIKVYCPICGHRLDGETVYEDRKTGEIFGCEY